jgi:replicative superfamily II helicase
MEEAADWVAANYDPEWTLSRALRVGIGMHHGRMPRALAQVVVKGFNLEVIDFLICTSTLIEGVNTKAKNVVIFDNKIATQKYDYFTFNNIRGRSGRMFEHFVGNVYLFHPEPQEDLPFVDIPVFTQDEKYPAC